MIRSVPIQLIMFVLTNKLVNEFRTFLMLKMYAKTGVIGINSNEQKLVIKKLKISEKTFKRHLKRLEKRHWIGNDSKNLFLRGWSFIDEQGNAKDFSRKVEVCNAFLNKTKFRGYLMGAVISYQVRFLNYKKREERKNGRSKQSRHNNSHPLSLTHLASLLKMTKSSIVNLKKEAIQNGFVFRYKNYHVTKTKISKDELNTLRKNLSGNFYPIRTKGKLVLIEPDLFSSGLIFKRFRYKTKLDPIINGYL